MPVLRVEEIPDVGVSVDERQVAAGAIASRQTVTGGHGLRVHAPSLGRQPVAERIGEEREASLVALWVRLEPSLVGESADRGPKLAVIPPDAMGIAPTRWRHSHRQVSCRGATPPIRMSAAFVSSS